jgi:hypothetical protein
VSHQDTGLALALQHGDHAAVSVTFITLSCRNFNTPQTQPPAAACASTDSTAQLRLGHL